MSTTAIAVIASCAWVICAPAMFSVPPRTSIWYTSGVGPNATAMPHSSAKLAPTAVMRTDSLDALRNGR